MTTDTVPGTHFFCVDVETSALTHWDGGELLSIGIVVVDADANIVDTFYRRIRATLDASWFNEELPARSDTQAWWREQDEFVKNEAYLDQSKPRRPLSEVAHAVSKFASQYGSDWVDRIFVASPDKFDWRWMDYLFGSQGAQDPFWYHGLDFWSFEQGRHAQRRPGKMKGVLDVKHRVRSVEADVPHHALSDAFAQAVDIVEALGGEVDALDFPTIEGWDEWRADQAAADGDLEEAGEEWGTADDEREHASLGEHQQEDE